MVALSGKGGNGLGLGKHVQGDSTVSVMFYFFKLRKVYTGVLLYFPLYSEIFTMTNMFSI